MCDFLYCSITGELEEVLVAPGMVGILTVSVNDVGPSKMGNIKGKMENIGAASLRHSHQHLGTSGHLQFTSPLLPVHSQQTSTDPA